MTLSCNRLRSLLAMGKPHQTRNINDQGDLTVAQKRCPRQALYPFVIGLERLDHRLLLTEQRIDQQARTRAIAFDHNYDAVARVSDRLRTAKCCMQRNDRQHLIAEAKYLACGAQPGDLLALDLQRLDHRYQRHDVAFRADRSEEHTSELQSLMRISYAVFCLTK